MHTFVERRWGASLKQTYQLLGPPYGKSMSMLSMWMGNRFLQWSKLSLWPVSAVRLWDERLLCRPATWKMPSALRLVSVVVGLFVCLCGDSHTLLHTHIGYEKTLRYFTVYILFWLCLMSQLKLIQVSIIISLMWSSFLQKGSEDVSCFWMSWKMVAYSLNTCCTVINKDVHWWHIILNSAVFKSTMMQMMERMSYTYYIYKDNWIIIHCRLYTFSIKVIPFISNLIFIS